MTAYRLHADFDRDGRLTARPGEWARRQAPPGALVRANLDSDARRLPTAVTPGEPVRLDRELPVKTAGDDEPAGLLVEEVTAAPGPLFVVLRGADALRCAVVDATGRGSPGPGRATGSASACPSPRSPAGSRWRRWTCRPRRRPPRCSADRPRRSRAAGSRSGWSATTPPAPWSRTRCCSPCPRSS
ncbi:hypothetical protein ACFQY7_07720 [Actinomadura luteofluorescens]|uniref:hypothetical protein n=1 Tax=Actinomadura luteofluorescens TaxID=46163 RepID=UPI003628ED87